MQPYEFPTFAQFAAVAGGAEHQAGVVYETTTTCRIALLMRTATTSGRSRRIGSSG